MRRVLRGLLAAGTALVVAQAACITDPDAELFINLSASPPAETSDLQVGFAGQVVRSPPSQAVTFTVTVTGGASTVSTDADGGGGFGLLVPLTVGAVNELVLVASGSDGISSSPRRFRVTQTGAP